MQIQMKLFLKLKQIGIKLNNVWTFLSKTDPDGIFQWKFLFFKPYQSKFVYKDRSENIITNESLLVIVDKDDYKIESYAIGDNILKKLLSKKFSIDEQFEIIKF